MSKSQELSIEEKREIELILDAVGGDLSTALFFTEWVKNGRNATKAYRKIFPKVTQKSAAVLGSRLLSRLDIPTLLSVYGVGVAEYIEKIKENLDATESVVVPVGTDKNGNKKYKTIKKPLHDVQEAYHTKLGMLLGLEGKTAAIQINQNNFNQTINNKKADYGI